MQLTQRTSNNSTRLPSERSSGSLGDGSSNCAQEATLIYMEDLAPEMDRQLSKTVLTPYFKGVFADLALRSTPLPKGLDQTRSIDKVTFIEYINLPGILSDQFLTIANAGCSTTLPDQRISEGGFVQLMLSVFSSNLPTKLRLVFNM